MQLNIKLNGEHLKMTSIIIAFQGAPGYTQTGTHGTTPGIEPWSPMWKAGILTAGQLLAIILSNQTVTNVVLEISMWYS